MSVRPAGDEGGGRGQQAHDGETRRGRRRLGAPMASGPVEAVRGGELGHWAYSFPVDTRRAAIFSAASRVPAATLRVRSPIVTVQKRGAIGSSYPTCGPDSWALRVAISVTAAPT
jgi:hypothetical protein